MLRVYLEEHPSATQAARELPFRLLEPEEEKE